MTTPPFRRIPLSERLAQFAGKAIRPSRTLPNDPGSRNLGAQLARSASSPVGSYSEAREATSVREYIYRMKLALKELRETRSWIKAASEAGFTGRAWTELDTECNELTAIVVTCIKKAREGPQEERKSKNEWRKTNG